MALMWNLLLMITSQNYIKIIQLTLKSPGVILQHVIPEFCRKKITIIKMKHSINQYKYLNLYSMYMHIKLKYF